MLDPYLAAAFVHPAANLNHTARTVCYQQPHQCDTVEFIAVNTNSNVSSVDSNNLLRSCLISN